MMDWVEVTEDQEKMILQWVINQIIKIIKSTETGRERKIKYLTKIKLQKMLFLVAEDAKIELTRAWYMFGGMVFAPIDIQATASSYYYYGRTKNQIPDEIKIGKILGKSRRTSINESIEANFEDIFFKKTEEFLEKFYTERAPKKYVGIYEEYREIKNTFQNLLDYQKQSDSTLLKFFPDFDPWIEASRLQKHITNFQLALPSILYESVLFLAVEFTRLIQRTAIQIISIKNEERNLTTNQRRILNQLEEAYTEILWKVIAIHIAVETFTGVRAEERRTAFNNRLEVLIRNLKLTLKQMDTQLKKYGLKPSAETLQIFFDKEYGEMFTEVMREVEKNGEDHITNSTTSKS